MGGPLAVLRPRPARRRAAGHRSRPVRRPRGRDGPDRALPRRCGDARPRTRPDDRPALAGPHPGAGLEVSSAPLPGRPHADRIAGCCRDHTLLAVGVLRAHGIPARSRIGFARYFFPGDGVDHVVVERWDGERWVRSDPELDAAFGAAPPAGEPFDPFDMPTGPDSPFPTAAELWTAHRRDGLDLTRYGVAGVPELAGRDFVRHYVLLEVAHRRRDEVLLWDLWGAALDGTTGAEVDALADVLADLLVRADAGDVDAEDELARRYSDDPRLHVGRRVLTDSPLGRRGWTDLVARTTVWDD
ncbi:transglutaminase-like domain-containing protein [Cellulomonas wangsupingiae]|uniref:Transglutaminase-like domain-containing protein n=1 Tax=Cellulomonas wangsupingiae TaxID=2968085 RepID=A0ABY5K6H0_9CELL|nr:transglutaminase-like domain-containing protein [Cellulomonas wangsupingiae]MCC2334379.1 transglutaminase-like domain-containing protein [Cellulomonas wangsupingiae]UUI66049.1 transglutaminase-like domain-containing protein [Cellulomonas wangsupingiae]